MLEKYHKIETLFERDTATKKLIEGKFRNEAVEYLKDNMWEFTEKIDGTNIRIYWDGHHVSFHGRTENAQLPAELTNKLFELFGGETNEQIFEQRFGELEVTLFGEGYGAKIQSGGDYSPTQEFILFDVTINNRFLDRENVKQVAEYFNLQVVPTIMVGTLKDAIEYVKTKPKSMIGKANSEGLVGRPMQELRDRNGDRLIVKVKVRDFE